MPSQRSSSKTSISRLGANTNPHHILQHKKRASILTRFFSASVFVQSTSITILVGITLSISCRRGRPTSSELRCQHHVIGFARPRRGRTMNDPRSSDECGWSLRKPHPGATWGMQDDRVERPRRGLTWTAAHISFTKTKKTPCCDARAAPLVSSSVPACFEASFGKSAPEKKQPSYLRLASQQGKP